MNKLISKMRGARSGFSLLEVLFTVLILSVLAAVAVPLYSETKTTAANKACMANIRILANAESKYKLDNGAYTTTATSLINEGIAQVPTCPLDGSAYTLTLSNGALTISCSSPTHTATNTMAMQ